MWPPGSCVWHEDSGPEEACAPLCCRAAGWSAGASCLRSHNGVRAADLCVCFDTAHLLCRLLKALVLLRSLLLPVTDKLC